MLLNFHCCCQFVMQQINHELLPVGCNFLRQQSKKCCATRCSRPVLLPQCSGDNKSHALLASLCRNRRWPVEVLNESREHPFRRNEMHAVEDYARSSGYRKHVLALNVKYSLDKINHEPTSIHVNQQKLRSPPVDKLFQVYLKNNGHCARGLVFVVVQNFD